MDGETIQPVESNRLQAPFLKPPALLFWIILSRLKMQRTHCSPECATDCPVILSRHPVPFSVDSTIGFLAREPADLARVVRLVTSPLPTADMYRLDPLMPRVYWKEQVRMAQICYMVQQDREHIVI